MLYSAIVLFVFSVAIRIDAQIPRPCATIDSLTARKCCPTPELNAGECGENIGRGLCQDVILEDNTLPDDDVRKNWPLGFFNRTCVCSEGFGGYDCGECGFGYIKNGDGSGCSKRAVLRKRTSLETLTEDKWAEYHDILRMARECPSRYMVITEQHDDVSDLVDSMVNATLYELFVWMHHFVAKDSVLKAQNKGDFAHRATGFPTWHRLFLLWLEKEIQELVGNPMFTLHYWDWRDPDQRTAYFTMDRLGENNNGTVNGSLFQDWRTVCWNKVDKDSSSVPICNPTEHQNQILRRCPDKSICDGGAFWPTYCDVDEAISIQQYDAPDYNRFIDENRSFRNYMEGFIAKKDEDCKDENTKLCTDEEGGYALYRMLHNSVHIILGFGHIRYLPPFERQGVMGDVAASPNDPIFINHHTMIDCILEEWLQRNNESSYPTDDIIPNGHNANDYIVPFIPLYTHSEMFKTADNFGYECTLPETALCTTDPSPSPETEMPETDAPGTDTPGTEGPRNKATASTVDQISLLATLFSALMIGNI